MRFHLAASATVLAISIAFSVSHTAAQQSTPRSSGKSVQLKPEWFDGLGAAGACAVLAPAQDYVVKNLTRDGIVDRRVALVIGNSAYQKAGWQLANPRNDAAGVSRLLQSVGFEVHVVLDGGARAIEACAAKAASKAADVSVLYYSGHGIQLEYKNYLVATDVADLDRSLAGFVSLDAIVAGMKRSSRAVLVFLDACRDNPLAGKTTQGLAPEQIVPRSVSSGAAPPAAQQRSTGAEGAAATLSGGELFIAFATSPNTTAADGKGSFSPFTESFLKHAATPGWLVQRVVAEVTKDVGEASNWSQTPWSRSSLTHEIFLNGGVDPVQAQRASELKAAQSRDLLAKGQRRQAIATALQGLPEKFGEDDLANYPGAYEALYWAVRSRSLQLPVKEAVHTSFSRDGARVVTVSQQVGKAARKDALTVWNTTTGERIAEMLPVDRSGTVGATLGPAKISGDSRSIIHVDPVKEVPLVWDAETGRLARELPKVPGASGLMVTVPKVELSATGRYALVSGGAGGVRLYDVSTGKAMSTQSSAMTMAAAISADETAVLMATATASSGGGPFKKIRIEAVGLADKKKLWSKDVSEETWGVYSITPSPDGKFVGLTTSSDALILFEPATGQTKRIVIPRAGMAGFSVSPDQRFVAVAPEDQSNSQPWIYSVETGEKVALPFTERASLDIVYDMSGAEVGVPWFADAGDIWRKGLTGPQLYDAAMGALSNEEKAAVAKERVRFR